MADTVPVESFPSPTAPEGTGQPDLTQVLEEVKTLDRAELVSFVCSDQRKRWRRGERLRVEAYLEHLPDLRDDADAILDMLFREVMLREDDGTPPALEELTQRFPDLGPQLRRQFEMHRALQSAPAPEAAPVGAQTVGLASEQTGDPEGQIPEERPRQRSGRPGAVPGYEILSELGRGGMGVVYKARQLKLGRVVALKMILSGGHAGPQQLARFQREAEAVACLQHPGIVQVYEVGEHEGRPYFSLEFVEGCNLAERIDGVPQPPRDAAQLVEMLARAAHYAHQHGIVHRDLKPANILLGGMPRPEAGPGHQAAAHATLPALTSTTPKITDFGLAKRLDSTEGQTATGDILGTPFYMAPEQALGRGKQVGPATDVYALGAILYELLTGRPPFVADTGWDVVVLVTSEEPLPPSRLQRRVPADLETVCLKCLEKEPARRYPSAEALADDLRRFLEGEPIHARPVSAPQRAWKWARRRPALAALLAVTLLAAAALVGGGAAYNVRLQGALQAARERTEESRQHLVRLHVANGTRLLDDNDWFGSLVWFVEALGLDQDDAERARLHRLRLAAVLRQCPKLRYLWYHEGAVNRARFSPDGRFLVTASDDRTARVRDVGTGVVGQPLTHDGPVVDAEFSADGGRVVTAGRDGSARVWDAAASTPLTPPLRQQGPLARAAFSPDGKRVLTAGAEPAAHLWDATTGTPLTTTFRHGAQIHWAAFSPDGSRVVTAGRDGTARLWTVDGSPAAEPLKHAGPVVHAGFSPGGKRVLTCSADGSARVWDAAEGRALTPPLRHQRAVVHGTWSPDGKHVATASEDGTARLWDAATGESAAPPLRHSSEVNQASFSADSRFVLTAGDDNTGRVWDAATGDPVAPLFDHNGSLKAVAFSPVGTFLVTTSNAGAVRVWDLAPERMLPDASGDAVGPLPPPEEGERSGVGAVTSPDGRRVVKVERGRTARVYDSATGQAVGLPLRHTSAITDVSFSRDGRHLVTGSDDNTARVWEAETGELLTPPLRHQGTVTHAAFDPSGRLVVTACQDKTARVWNAETGEPLTPPLRHPCPIERATISPAADRVLTRGADGIARAWVLRPDERPIDDLRRQAELLSGNHLDLRRGYLPLDTEELGQLGRR